MPFVDSAGARIHWEAEGEGTAVLLIMGHLYSGRFWYPLLPSLTKRHRAIWFDNRGTGESATTATTTIAQMADDALAVLDAAGAGRAHVVGVSLGGVIAAEFALRHPDRVASLTLGCTLMKSAEKRVAGPLRRLIYRLPLWLVRAMLGRSLTRASYGSAATPEAVAKDRQVARSDRFTMKGVRAQANALLGYVTTREAVASITAPTLVLHGDEDKVIDPKHGRELADVIPGARLVVFEGAGHNFLVAAGKTATAALLKFFASVDKAGGAVPPAPKPARARPARRTAAKRKPAAARPARGKS